MSASGPYDITNTEQLRQLTAQLDALTDMVEEHYRSLNARDDASAEDRQELRARVVALEARPLVNAADVEQIKAAIAVQLSVHRWWTAHRVRARLGAAAAFLVGVFGGPVVSLILHRLGWL